jgi:hypothetical protein
LLGAVLDVVSHAGAAASRLTWLAVAFLVLPSAVQILRLALGAVRVRVVGNALAAAARGVPTQAAAAGVVRVVVVEAVFALRRAHVAITARHDVAACAHAVDLASGTRFTAEVAVVVIDTEGLALLVLARIDDHASVLVRAFRAFVVRDAAAAFELLARRTCLTRIVRVRLVCALQVQSRALRHASVAVVLTLLGKDAGVFRRIAWLVSYGACIAGEVGAFVVRAGLAVRDALIDTVASAFADTTATT